MAVGPESYALGAGGAAGCATGAGDGVGGGTTIGGCGEGAEPTICGLLGYASGGGLGRSATRVCVSSDGSSSQESSGSEGFLGAWTPSIVLAGALGAGATLGGLTPRAATAGAAGDRGRPAGGAGGFGGDPAPAWLMALYGA